MPENQPAVQGASVAEEVSLFDSIVKQNRAVESDSKRACAKDIIGELTGQVLSGTVMVPGNLSAMLDARVTELDRLILQQLNVIMYTPKSQRLEPTRRGLHYLVKETSTGQMIKTRMLNAAKCNLTKGFKTVIEFDQSALFKKVYEEEPGTFGGASLGALIDDYGITRQLEDMYLIEQMAHVAAASYAPFIASSSPGLLGLESFVNLDKLRNLAKVLNTVKYTERKPFHDSEDSRYVGLTLSCFLNRLPYSSKDGTVVENFNFAEDVDDTDHSKYLQCNTAWALGARLTAAFDDFG